MFLVLSLILLFIVCISLTGAFCYRAGTRRSINYKQRWLEATHTLQQEIAERESVLQKAIESGEITDKRTTKKWKVERRIHSSDVIQVAVTDGSEWKEVSLVGITREGTLHYNRTFKQQMRLSMREAQGVADALNDKDLVDSAN